MYYPSPWNGWFATTRCNSLLLIFSLCCGCLLLVTLSLQYHCNSTFRYRLLLLIITIVFSLSLLLLTILFSSYLCLVDITSPILVAIILYLSRSSSTCTDSFTSPFRDCQRTSTHLFTYFWYSSTYIFSSSVSIFPYLLQLSSSCPDHLLLVLITFLLLVAMIEVLLLLSSPYRGILLLVYFPRWYNFSYPSRNSLFLVLIFFPLYGLLFTCPDSFDYPCYDCCHTSTRRD